MQLKDTQRANGNEEYTLISLDVVSLFTNVPLWKAVNIIIDRVYNKKLIKTTLSKNVLKKLILYTCQKTLFTFNNIIYEQKDGVSMGASLGPALANIIMTECEKVIVDNLVKEGTIKFYIHYVDDSTLTWTSLLCGNGKRPRSDHMLIEQRKYVQNKTFQKNSN